jgi:hypothetical protein
LLFSALAVLADALRGQEMVRLLLLMLSIFGVLCGATAPASVRSEPDRTPMIPYDPLLS